MTGEEALEHPARDRRGVDVEPGAHWTFPEKSVTFGAHQQQVSR